MATRRPFTDLMIAVLFAVALALGIRIFLVESYRVPTAIMAPTLIPGDLIFVVKWPYGIRLPRSAEPWIKGRGPRYGEVVVYNPLDAPDRTYIRRVVGLAGDVVKVQAGRVWLNDRLVEFEPSSVTPSCGTELHPGRWYSVCLNVPLIDDFGPRKIPEDYVFVIGDERQESLTRQPHAIIPISTIQGKAAAIWMSVVPGAPSLAITPRAGEGAEAGSGTHVAGEQSPSPPTASAWPQIRWDRVFMGIR